MVVCAYGMVNPKVARWSVKIEWSSPGTDWSVGKVARGSNPCFPPLHRAPCESEAVTFVDLGNLICTCLGKASQFEDVVIVSDVAWLSPRRVRIMVATVTQASPGGLGLDGCARMQQLANWPTEMKWRDEPARINPVPLPRRRILEPLSLSVSVRGPRALDRDTATDEGIKESREKR